MIFSKLPLSLFMSSLFFHAALGEIVCEELPLDICAFAIASSGKRCLLETSTTNVVKGGGVEYECKTSEVVVKNMVEYIETDKCVKACGLDRKSVGISSDSLLEPQFTVKLCAQDCYQNCPNIVDLYFNLSAAEGVYLPDLCVRQLYNPHRAMEELLSSGAAPGPVAHEPGPVASPTAPTPIN
ncbi:uncharacterized protein LOC133800334 [Humulus lupulus]|uniref:uncharacterized protein LOC133800334 n=1 Tax=Humulus lupulus TaxID=3486 RepID=UPI002B40AE52|nr:uncharacterized protein LOC133800334 [Humulus lupulus]